MQVFRVHDRSEYLRTQITRSNSKFDFCKASIHDVTRYRQTLAAHAASPGQPPGGPILCLGVRSGREVDLFRIGFFGPAWLRRLVSVLEAERHSFVALVPPLEAIGRSTSAQAAPDGVVGVEINPRAARRDVWIGSFDDMPPDWENRFRVLYSNSFDQSQDPERTAREWKRVARPGAYLIFLFAKDASPSPVDPIGELSLGDVLRLFSGELLYFHERGSRAGYSEVILRLPKS